MNDATLGFLRALGTVVVFSVVHFLADSSHLTSVLSPEIATLVAAFALAYEHSFESKGGGALFGAVKTTR